MRFRLRIRPAADADVDALALHIARDSMEAALRFYDAVDRTYREIRDHPQRYPLYELSHRRLAGMRKCAVTGFRRYLIFYRIEDNVVEIIRVLHGARDIPVALGDEV